MVIERLFNGTAEFKNTIASVDEESGLITTVNEETTKVRCRLSVPKSYTANNQDMTAVSQNYVLILPPGTRYKTGYDITFTYDDGDALTLKYSGSPLYYSTHIEIPVKRGDTDV